MRGRWGRRSFPLRLVQVGGTAAATPRPTPDLLVQGLARRLDGSISHSYVG